MVTRPALAGRHISPEILMRLPTARTGEAGLKVLLWDGGPIHQASARIRHGLLELPHADFHKAHAPLPVRNHLTQNSCAQQNLLA
jgi:hypothetical protein